MSVHNKQSCFNCSLATSCMLYTSINVWLIDPSIYSLLLLLPPRVSITQAEAIYDSTGYPCTQQARPPRHLPAIGRVCTAHTASVSRSPDVVAVGSTSLALLCLLTPCSSNPRRLCLLTYLSHQCVCYHPSVVCACDRSIF